MINMEAIELPYMKLLLTACMPTCASPKSVGLDLYSPISVLILAHNKVLIDMGIAFQIPMGYYGQIAPRSGLAIHHHIHVGTGVVDPWLHWLCPHVTIKSQFPEPCYRSKPLHSPINSGKSCLSNPLSSTTNALDRVWCPWIWLNRAMNVQGWEEPNWSLTS